MEVTEKGPETFHNFEIDMTEKERATLLKYAMEHLSGEELDGMMLEWAMIDILKEACNKDLENNS